MYGEERQAVQRDRRRCDLCPTARPGAGVAGRAAAKLRSRHPQLHSLRDGTRRDRRAQGQSRQRLFQEAEEFSAGSEGPESAIRSEEHTSELQSLMRISYAVFCLKKKKKRKNTSINNHIINQH